MEKLPWRSLTATINFIFNYFNFVMTDQTANSILITSAGKRVELLLEFKAELRKYKPEGKIFAADLNPIMAPACHLADKAFKVSKVIDPEYINELLSICKDNHIRIVIPTIDTELEVLSQHIQDFRSIGTEVIVSEPKFIRTCRDKRITNIFFENRGIRIPRPIDPNTPEFPMFAKPYDGSLSTNIHLITSPEYLTHKILSDSKLMFMEVIDKTEYREFTVDMYYSKDGIIKSIVPRERLEIRSGEVNKGITRRNYIVQFLKERLEHLPLVKGCICLQLFYRETDNDIVGIEINPRFGGGYPLSYHAGANYPANIIKEYLLNENLNYNDDWREDTIMLRYDSQVIL